MEWKRLSIVQRHKSRGIKTWYLRENSNGVISYKSLGTTHKKTAEACLQRLLVLRFALPNESVQIIDIQKMIDAFLSRTKIQENSAEQYARILKEFSNWCAENRIANLLDFNLENARSFYASLKGKTARHKCRVCGIFFNWVFREFRIEKIQPFKLVEYRPVEKKIRDFWTPKQIEKIIENAPTREFRVLWALMAYAGLRFSEANFLRQENIDDNSINLIGKGKKYSTLPINKKLSQELELFGSLENGLNVRKESSIRALVKICKTLGFKGWASNHKFRHSYATNLAASGCPVSVAMRLMRHSSSHMTLDVYTHVISEDLKKWSEMI